MSTRNPVLVHLPLVPLFIAAPALALAADDDEDETEAGPAVETGSQQAERKKRRVTEAGVATSDTLVQSQLVGVADATPTDAWQFNFKGFFRAPMRLGFQDVDGGTAVHAIPVVPDWNYTAWQYSNANPGPWVEMMFQYGNDRVTMTTAVAAYNVTSGGWRELQAQLGIDRAFLTLHFPEAIGDRGGLALNVGVFHNRYGAAGRYDAGAYETFLFGRTRNAGETLTGNIWLTDDLTLLVEHGIGAKTDIQKWTEKAGGSLGKPYEVWEPYPGPVQQGATLLHHAHLGLSYREMLTATLHYIDAWTKDDRAGYREAYRADLSAPIMGRQPYNCARSDTACRIRVMGADLKLIGGWLGEGYLGVSHVDATNAVTVSDAIELLHSQGGWQLTNNYFGGEGTGKMTTVLFQYQFSLAAFLLRPQQWWGDGADLVVRLFGMYNSISGTDAVPQNGSGTQKLKFGADALYTPLPTLGFGGRVDVIQPNMEDSTRSFTVLTPRLVLRTRFVTHEMVVFQYSHYLYGSNVLLPFPFQPADIGGVFPATRGDRGVFTISAQMWW